MEIKVWAKIDNKLFRETNELYKINILIMWIYSPLLIVWWNYRFALPITLENQIWIEVNDVILSEFRVDRS